MPPRWSDLLFTLSLAGPAAAQERVTAFVDVSVIPMDAELVLPGQTVLVRGDRIVGLGPVARTPVPRGAVRIDGRGKFLIPGLSDMHVHLGIAAMEHGRNGPWDSAAAEAAVRRQLFLFVANGVTTIRNVDYFSGLPRYRLASAVVLRLRKRAAAGKIWSPRVYTSGGWRELGDSYSVAQNLAAYQAAGYDFVKLRDEESAIRDSVIAVAHLLGLPFMGHVDSVRTALATHYASVEHLTGYPGTGLDFERSTDTAQLPELVAATQRAGVWNCPTQTLYEMSDTNPAAWPEARYATGKWMTNSSLFWLRDTSTVPVIDTNLVMWLQQRRRTIKALQDAGAGLLLGTDTPGRVAGFGVHRELQALVGAGLTPYQALVTGTRNVAAYFGALNERGTVAVGKRADLVLLTGNPLMDIRHTAEPAGVMVGGRWLPRAAIDKQLAKYVTKQ